MAELSPLIKLFHIFWKCVCYPLWAVSALQDKREKAEVRFPLQTWMVWIKFPLHFPPPFHSSEPQCCLWHTTEEKTLESHFSQGFEMSLWSWSGGNWSHMPWVRRKPILKQKNPSLGPMTSVQFSHRGRFTLVAVRGLFG